MHTFYFNEYSYNLNRNMEFKVFGNSGRPLLIFPAQNGRFYDFENYGMIESIKPFIDEGKIQVFCVDSIDIETWSNESWDNRKKIEKHEDYFHYICDEFVPRLFSINAESNNNEYMGGIITSGCSMGATHAMNFFLRRPDIFDGVISLSGVYRASYFFKEYSDDLVYANSPIQYIEGMPYDHPYVEIYRNRLIIACVGKGSWEEPMIEDTLKLKSLFEYKNIPCWIDIWGSDVSHDWIWWRKQLPYFLSKII